MFVGLVAISVPAGLALFGAADSALIRLSAFATVLMFLLMMTRSSILLKRTQEQAAELVALSMTDPLTAAANRRHLMIRLREELDRAERYHSPLSLVFIDLDHFKQFNDQHGHDAGDDLLKRCVELWQQELRATDLLARAGGEEFVVLLPETSDQAAQQMVVRLMAVMPGSQTLSAGLTQNRPEDDSDAILKRGDDAMYEAKAAGRNTVVTL